MNRDIVVIIDLSLLRLDGRWPLAQVIKIHPGADGLVRVATVRLGNRIFTRLVAKLHRLSVDVKPRL